MLTRCGRDAFNGRDDLGSVLAEHDVAGCTCRSSSRRGLVESQRAQSIWLRDQSQLRVGRIAAVMDDFNIPRIKPFAKIAHLTPFTVPPFSTQTMVAFALIATDIGNSPSDDTGVPTIVSFDGLLGLIANMDSVFEPGCR